MASTINALNTTSGVAITPDSSGILQLQTANTTAVTVDASQNVSISNNLGVGTTSPLTKAEITGTGLTLATGTSNGLWFNRGGTAVQVLSKDTPVTDVVTLQNPNGAALVFGTNSTERAKIDSTGNLLVTGGGGLGYGTGSGGTVTQLTSRSTAVTINKPTGSITLVSAAGSPTWTGFVVNNSTVAATDTIVLSFKSHTNFYLSQVYNVTAGLFVIAISANSGTATEAVTINFAVIKGATA